MSAATRDTLLRQVKDLRTAAEAAGIVEADPWASLDDVWKGPDVNLEEIRVIGEETISAVVQAYGEGRVGQAVLVKALDLAKTLLPLALAAL